MNEVVIVGAARTPIGRFKGVFAKVPATHLGAVAIRAALTRANLDPHEVAECLMDNVAHAGMEELLTQRAAQRAGLPPKIQTGMLINKTGGSSLKTVAMAIALIRNGEAEAVVAGGMENMSRGSQLVARTQSGNQPPSENEDKSHEAAFWASVEQQRVINSAESLARTHKVSRQQQDTYAFQSHRRAVAAQQAGRFQAEIAPVEVPTGEGQRSTLVDKDELPQRELKLEALANLRTTLLPNGTVTSSNSCAPADGAAALVLMSRKRADALGLKPLARILDLAQSMVFSADVLTAPTIAVRRLLERAEREFNEFDLLEMDELFAAQIIANGRELDIDWKHLNIHGGTIALGHPIGASGSRSLVTLLYSLQHYQRKWGLVVVGAATGEALALAVERY